jgi:methionyl-tRNA synthetase
MIALEEENTKSVIEAAGGVAANNETATSTPAAKTAGKGASVSENSEKLKTVGQTAVDSIGAEPEDEAKAYETVAAANAPVAAPAPAAVVTPAPPQVAQLPEGFPPASPQITIDDVVKLDLRVAQIVVAERIPKADKLLRLEVDLGYEKRQILAGIAQYYEPEKLVGRKIVIVANLAPRKMRGLISNGMLLAASLENSSPVLAGFLEEVPLGARLK